MVRAKAFLPGAIEGPGRTEGYMKLDPSQADFSSDLPIVLLHKFSRWTASQVPTPARGFQDSC